MTDLNEVLVFTKVIQAGSFSQAARQLAMPNSTVSAKVSSLEKRLGTTLITRTTRRLKITPAGQAFFERCLQGLEEIKLGEDQIASIQGEPQGLLRLTAPVDLGASILPPIISAYAAKYPKVTVEMILTDRRVELLTEGIDLAIRAGELRDSTLIGKKLGASTFAPYASQKYIKIRGKPSHPKELKDHQLLHFTPLGSESWKLMGPRGPVNVSVPAKIIINDLATIKSFAMAGMGIALLPTFVCQQEIESGKLTRILPGWQTAESPIHFVYPAQKFVSSRLSAFIELATEPLKAMLRKS